MVKRKNRATWTKNIVQEELAHEITAIAGFPKPREAKSQKAQLNSEHQHGTRKDRKIKYHKKIT